MLTSINFELSEADLQLKKQILSKGKVTASELDEIIGELKHTHDTLLNADKGRIITCSHKGVLQFLSFPDNELLAEIELLEPVEPSGPQMPMSLERGLVFINPEDGRHSESKQLRINQPYGLYLGSQFTALYHANWMTDSLLGGTETVVDMPRDKAVNRAYFDLVVSPNHAHLFVFERAIGTLHVICLSTYQRLKSLQILKQGSYKSLNFAFDDQEPKVYITDNQTQNLYTLDLKSFSLDSWFSGLGVLGNLHKSPLDNYLYIAVIRPQCFVMYFSLEAMALDYTLDIKGVSGAHQGFLPQDPMQPTPGNLLAYMNYLEQGSGLPLVQVIDMAKAQTIRRYTIKDNTEPDLFLLGLENPFLKLQELTLKRALLDKGLLTEDEVAVLSSLQTQDAPQIQMQPPKDTVYESPLEDYPLESLYPLVDVEGPEIDFPPEARDVVVNILIWHFYQKTLTNLMVHAKELFKIKKIAAGAIKKLRHKMAVLVRIPGVLGKYSLEIPVGRDQVIELLQTFASGDGGVCLQVCPDCSFPWDSIQHMQLCESCGYTFDSAEEKAWRQLTSPEDIAGLSPGQKLLVLKEHAQIAVINPWGEMVDAYHLSPQLMNRCANFMVLPDHRLLLTDEVGGNIVELDELGKILRRCKGKLNQPRFARQYLDSEDQNILLFIDAEKIQMEGRLGQVQRCLHLGESDLKAPSEVQVLPDTHWLVTDPEAGMVLEYDVQLNVVKRWDSELGIEKPIFARRLPNGQTLIVDGIQFQVSVFEDSNLLQEWSYWPLPEGLENEAKPPHYIARLHNGELLFQGNTYYFQLDPRTGVCRGPFPLPKPSIRKLSGRELKINASQRSYEKQEKIDGFLQALQKFEMFQEIPQARLKSLAEALKPICFQPGDTVIEDLEQSPGLYFMTSGSVEISKQDMAVFQLEAEEVLGAIAMILAKGKLAAKVVALSEVQALFLDKVSYKRALIRFPRLFHLLRGKALDRHQTIRRFQDEEAQARADKLALKMMMSKAKQHPLLTGGEPQFYLDLAARLKPIAFLPNQVVYSRGESAGTVYFINEGEVGVQRQGERNCEITIGDGHMFGEMAYFTQEQRNATILTLDYSRLYELEYHDFEALLTTNQWLYERLQKVVEKRKAQNKSDQQKYQKAMGIARNDLPQTDVWSPLDLKEDRLMYFPVTLMGFILGVETTGHILWCCGQEPDRQFFQPYRVHIKDDNAYIVDTGNDRVVMLNIDSRQIIHEWSGEFDQPRSAVPTKDEGLMIADEAHSRLVKIDMSGQIVWRHEAPHEIMSPFYAEETTRGTILFADKGLHKVYEIDPNNQVKWSYGELMIAGDGPGQLCEPTYVHRLGTGEILIADQGNDRLILLDRRGKETAVFYGTEAFPISAPKHCDICENGDILIYFEHQEQILRLDKWGDPVWFMTLRANTEVHTDRSSHDWDAVFEAPLPRLAENVIDETKGVANLIPDLDQWGDFLTDDADLQSTVIVKREN